MKRTQIYISKSFDKNFFRDLTDPKQSASII